MLSGVCFIAYLLGLVLGCLRVGCLWLVYLWVLDEFAGFCKFVLICEVAFGALVGVVLAEFGSGLWLRFGLVVFVWGGLC